MSTGTLHLVPDWIFIPNSLTLFTCFILVISAALMFIIKRRNFIKAVEKLPGIPGLPLIGNALTFLVSREGRESIFCCFVSFLMTGQL